MRYYGKIVCLSISWKVPCGVQNIVCVCVPVCVLGLTINMHLEHMYA